MKNFALGLLILLSVFLSGCPRQLRMPEQDLLATSRIVAITEKQNLLRQRLSGKFQAKGVGIKQFFGHVDLTVALQLPSSFYVSVPTFFGTPARVVTSDGTKLYLFDMSGPDPLYLTEPSNSKSLEKWLGMAIDPKDFVNGILGVVDLSNTKIVETTLNRSQGHYDLTLETKDNKKIVAEFDMANDDLLSQSMFQGSKLLYRIEYKDLREQDGRRFPRRSKIVIKTPKESISLQLEASDLDFPNEPFETSTFQLEEP